MKFFRSAVNAVLPLFFAASAILGIVGAVLHKSSGIPFTFILFPVGAAVSFFLALKLERVGDKLNGLTVKELRRYYTAACLILTAVQALAAVLSDHAPINDLSYISTGMKNLVVGRELYTDIPDFHSDYFECYSNNHMLSAVIFLLYKAEYAVTGRITDVLPITLNIAGLSLSYLLMCRCAELVHTPQKAFVCACRGLLFTPFVTYAANYYTDTMAMPLMMTAVYIYLKNRGKLRLSHILLCGGLVGAAYKMKGSAAVLVIALVIDMIRERCRLSSHGAFLGMFAAVSRFISWASVELLGLSRQLIKEKGFPFIHWIMMSASGRGGYEPEDFYYTQSFPGNEKVSADLARLGEKLREQGVFGFLWHLVRKISYTWENFTFMAGYYNSLYKKPIFVTAAFICYWTLISSVFLSLWGKRKKDDPETFLFSLCLVGLCGFLLIWETRCRYLISFFPIFMMI